jgi:histidyl-tRNA synthetase
VNSLGGPEARAIYRNKLIEFFEPKKAQLSEHACERLLDNPLRILDSKDERDRKASEGAPALLDCLSDDDRSHFQGFLAALDALGTPYSVNPRLVRGLDYYTRTCFEIVAESGEIGSQSAILGGGRYDGMLAGLGGPDVPAIGFAMGLERILLALGEQVIEEAPLCFIAPLGIEAALEGLKIGAQLRERGISAEIDSRGSSLKSMLRRANNMNARYAVVLGKNEVKEGIAQLKDLSDHTQSEVSLADIAEKISLGLAARPTDSGVSAE